MSGEAYRQSAAQLERLGKHPRVSGSFALDKGLWDGREVAVEFLRERGNLRRHTDMRIAYGTLVLAPNKPERADQIGVRAKDGSVRVIHKSRAKNVYDLTRTKGA